MIFRHFAAEWPTLFMYDEDMPRLDAFRPELRPKHEELSTEEDLRQVNDKNGDARVIF